MGNKGINRGKLKALRIKKKLSQNALDALAGVSSKTTRNAEDNDKGITVRTLWKLADALDVHPSYFLD